MKRFDILGEIHWCNAVMQQIHEERRCSDYPLKSRGEIAIDVPPPEVFDDSVKQGFFSGFRIGADPFRGKLETLEKMTGPVHIDLIRVRPDYQKLPSGKASGISYEEFARDYYDRCFDFARKYPDRVMLCGIAEFDSCCPWPKNHCFADKKEGFEFFKHAVFHLQIGSGDPATLFKRLEERKLTFADINMMAHGACLFALHYYFEWGFPHVELERGIGATCNMSLSLAYMRGAWKQAGRKSRWGIDYSTHNASFNRLNHYMPDGKRFGGRTESLILRSYLLSYLSGADYLLCEGNELTHYVYQGDSSFELSQLGLEAKKFADYALRGEKERGTPVIPAAVMLEYCNGYEGSNAPFNRPAIWGNCYPFGVPEAHITNLFEFLCPGFTLSNRDASPAIAGLPWKTRQEMIQRQFAGEDMRPYEKGFLASSALCDSFDVLLDNAEKEILSEYKVLILAGDAAPTPEKLLEYMKQGGTLCASGNQLKPEMLDAMGIKPAKGFADDWEIDTITMKDGEEFTGLCYVFSRFELPERAEIRAVNSRNVPVIISVPFGKGKLLLSSVPYGQDSLCDTLLFCWKRILEEEISRHLPVKASHPGLELMVNRTGSGWLVGAFNNTASAWSGTLNAEGFSAKELTVAPFEAKVLRCEEKNPWEEEYIVNC